MEIISTGTKPLIDNANYFSLKVTYNVDENKNDKDNMSSDEALTTSSLSNKEVDKNETAGQDMDDSELERILSRGVSKRTYTIVEAPEFIERLGPHREAQCGDDVTFCGRYRAFPRPNVTWFRDNEELKQTVRHTFEHPEEDNSDIVKLHIKDLGPLDEGTYKCKIENDEGVASTTGYLTVIGRPSSRKCSPSSPQPHSSAVSQGGATSRRAERATTPSGLRPIIEQKSVEELEAEECRRLGPSPIQEFIDVVQHKRRFTKRTRPIVFCPFDESLFIKEQRLEDDDFDDGEGEGTADSDSTVSPQIMEPSLETPFRQSPPLTSPDSPSSASPFRSLASKMNACPRIVNLSEEDSDYVSEVSEPCTPASGGSRDPMTTIQPVSNTIILRPIASMASRKSANSNETLQERRSKLVAMKEQANEVVVGGSEAFRPPSGKAVSISIKTGSILQNVNKHLTQSSSPPAEAGPSLRGDPHETTSNAGNASTANEAPNTAEITDSLRTQAIPKTAKKISFTSKENRNIGSRGSSPMKFNVTTGCRSKAAALKPKDEIVSKEAGGQIETPVSFIDNKLDSADKKNFSKDNLKPLCSKSAKSVSLSVTQSRLANTAKRNSKERSYLQISTPVGLKRNSVCLVNAPENTDDRETINRRKSLPVSFVVDEVSLRLRSNVESTEMPGLSCETYTNQDNYEIERKAEQSVNEIESSSTRTEILNELFAMMDNFSIQFYLLLATLSTAVAAGLGSITAYAPPILIATGIIVVLFFEATKVFHKGKDKLTLKT